MARGKHNRRPGAAARAQAGGKLPVWWLLAAMALVGTAAVGAMVLLGAPGTPGWEREPFAAQEAAAGVPGATAEQGEAMPAAVADPTAAAEREGAPAAEGDAVPPAAAPPPGGESPGEPESAAPAGPADVGLPGEATSPVPESERQPIPILMYHELGEGPNSLYVRVDDFKAHLAYLAEAGYTPITLDQAYRHLVKGEPLAKRPVVITFDDGYASFYKTAFPLLQERGFPATLFVITGLVGRPNYVTWEQLQEMAAAGIEIGAHSVTHPDLRGLGPERLNQETGGAREALKQHLQVPVAFYCYPAGKHDAAAVAAVAAAGYRGAVTTAYGVAGPKGDPYLWPRVRVSRGVTARGLAALLEEAVAP